MGQNHQLNVINSSLNCDSFAAQPMPRRQLSLASCVKGLCKQLSNLTATVGGPLLVAALAFAPTSASADVVLDSFERTAISPWTFFNDSGASGSLALGTGRTGKGAVLSYNLSSGHYVSANLNLRTRPTASAISLWVKSPPNIYVRLRVVDATGQTLQYHLNRPVTAMADANAWYQQIVALNGAGDWWGGANDGVLHNPIASIGILAADPPEAGPRASISFDDVTAITTLEYSLNPSGTVIPGPSTSGNFLSNMGVAIHFTTDEAGLNAAQAAGFAWVRTDLFWSDIETSRGRYTWTKYDALVAALERRGMRALFILDYGNTLYTPQWNSPPTTAAAMQAYAAFSEAAARHFAGKGVRLEVWNEANLTRPWTAAQYATLSRDSIRRAHLGDSTSLVSTTGVAGFDFAFIRGYLNQGGGTGANAIGVHPYDVSNPPGDLVEKTMHLRDIVRPFYSSTQPAIWNTEWGYSSTDFSSPRGNGHSADGRRRQAVLAVREMLSCFAVGFPSYIYYDLRDDGTNAAEREHNFGLLANNYSEKPAMVAVKTMARLTRGRTFAGFLPTTPTSLTAMRFDGTSDKVVVLWSSAPRSSVTVIIPSGATVTNMLGAAVTVQNQRLVLREADGPIYITSR